MSDVFSAYLKQDRSNENKRTGQRIIKIENIAGDVKKTMLYGTDINDTQPSSCTDDETGRIVFHDRRNRKSFEMNDELFSRHTLLLGGTGSGKTNVEYQCEEKIFSRLTKRDVVFVFDPKGDQFRRLHKKCPYGYIVIGNQKEYEMVTSRWICFEELIDSSARRMEANCKELAKELFIGRESSSQPFFAQSAADLTAKVMIDFLRRGDMDPEGFVCFLKEASPKKFDDLIKRNRDFESARMYFGSPEKLTNQALGVFGYITSMVNDLFQDIFAGQNPEVYDENGHRISCEAPGFSMRNLVRNRGGIVVFIEYDLTKSESLGPIYRILIDLASKEAMNQKEESVDGNIWFFLDEFKLLPNSQHIDNILNYGRSLGIKVIAGLQSVSQLNEVYGEEKAATILSGFTNLISFRTADPVTREYIVSRFGKNYYNLSFHVNSDDPTNIQVNGNTVEDWDILALKTGDAFVSLYGAEPFRFEFAEYKGDR